jgi:glycerophosphoryl diester phosphodiesterase
MVDPRTSTVPHGPASLHRYLTGPQPAAIAHRGGTVRVRSTAWAENTISAFQGSYDIGIRHMETDVHLTSDGVVVAFHDDDLGRVTDATGRIGDFTAEQLAGVTVAGCERIPTLDALLARFPEVRFSIDPKGDEVVDALGDVLVSQNALDRVCVGAFSDERLRRMQARFGERLCIAGGPGAVVEWAEAVTAGRPISNPPNLYAVPPFFGDTPLVTEATVASAHEAGAHVHVWTVDAPEEMHRLFDLGVDGIITDRPDVLKSVLIDRGEWLA